MALAMSRAKVAAQLRMMGIQIQLKLEQYIPCHNISESGERITQAEKH
jgi:hypothetical protein